MGCVSRCDLCAVFSSSQYVFVCACVCALFVIECKVKGTPGRDGDEGEDRKGEGWGGVGGLWCCCCCCGASGQTHPDGHHIEISKWTAERRLLPYLPPPLFQREGPAMWGQPITPPTHPCPLPPPPPAGDSYLFTACFALVP